MAKYAVPGFRLGCVSYLLPTGYVPGVRFAARFCPDVTLLLFETGKGGACALSPAEVRELGRIAEGEGTSYTVHLPADADFATAFSAGKLTEGALVAVERTAPLSPQAYVLHIPLPDPQQPEVSVNAEEGAFTERVRHSLERIAAALPDPAFLALENLEGQPSAFLDVWLEQGPWSRCFDVGHVWKDVLSGQAGRVLGQAPVPELVPELARDRDMVPPLASQLALGIPSPEDLLPLWLPRCRLFHLHGVRSGPGPASRPGGGAGQRLRDHLSLRLLPEATLDAFAHPLWASGFSGLVTLEVFSPKDLETSWQSLLESYARYERKAEQAACLGYF